MPRPQARPCLLVILSVLTFGSLWARAADRTDPSPPKPQRVAVLDVAAVIRSHPRFKAEMAELRADNRRAEQHYASERADLEARQQRLTQLAAGSPARLEEEKQLAKALASSQLRAELQRKESLEREGKIYHRVYQEIVQEVNEFARANQFTVVLRVSDVPPQATSPDHVLTEINRQVVWSDDSVDITQQIIERVSRRARESQTSLLDAKPQAKPDKETRPAKSDAKPQKKEAKPEKKQTKPAAPKKAKVLRFHLKGSLPELSSPISLFSDFEPSLAATVKRMDQAAEDESVAAVWLRIDGLDIGQGKLNELRAAIQRLRNAGKPVYAELAGANTTEYLVAAACDQIALAPSGSLLLPGVRAEVTFYKGLLDKLGIQFDLLQMGKYKGAGEPLTRTDLSPAVRESLEKMVDDAYGETVGLIAKDRKLPPAKVKELLDQGMFTAQMAHKAGLVDQVAYADELQASLRARLQADEIEVLPAKEKKAMDADLSGLSGFMKLMEMALGGKPQARPTPQQKIAVVYAVGPIVTSSSSGGLFREELVSANTLVKVLRSAADDPKVLAIVLRIDSPGGSAVASDLIWREVVRINKPVIASMGDVAASGGYYIAMGARKIYAEPGTVTGSIGVVGGKLVLGGLYQKLGITTEVISRGKNSGALSDIQPFTPDQRKAWTALLEATYRQFVAKAAQGRNMPVAKLEQLAQGRVYTGRMAAANGLVDALGTLSDAVAEAKKAAGLKPDDKVELQVLPRPKTLFEQLFGDEGELTSDLRLALPGRRSPLGQAALLRHLFAEPTLLLMPLEVKLR